MILSLHLSVFKKLVESLSTSKSEESVVFIFLIFVKFIMNLWIETSLKFFSKLPVSRVRHGTDGIT